MAGKSQALGALFESVFLQTCRLNGVAITRVPDGCRQFSNKIIRVKSPWDFVLTYQGRSALIDTKTSQGSKFSHSAISPHQVRELLNHERSGAISGYVIWLRGSHNVFFMPARALMTFIETRGSFDHLHPSGVYLGDERFDIRKIFERIRIIP